MDWLCAVVLIYSKGLIEKNINCAELEQLFSGIITTAIISQWMKNNMKWKESIALFVVNIEYSLPNINKEDLMELVTSIFTDSIFNLTPFISDYINCLTIQSKDKNKMTNVISEIELHYKKEVYEKVALFSETISSLWMDVNLIQRTAVLYSLNQLAHNIHTSYHDYIKVGIITPHNDNFERTIMKGCNRLYLSLLVLFSFISSTVTDRHALQILNILSELEFCSIKIDENELEIKTSLIDSLLTTLAKSQSNFIKLIVNNYDEINGISLSFPSVITALPQSFSSTFSLLDDNKLQSFIESSDIMTNSRFSFLLHLFNVVLEKLPNECSEKILEDNVVPICFIFLDHQDKLVNSLSHSVFQKLFVLSLSLRDTIVPYYIKKSLENYPLITQPKSLSTSMSILVNNLDPSSPFIPLCIENFVEKIQSTQEKKVPYLTIILFELINHIHRYLLPYLLGKIETFVLSSPVPLQNIYCRLLFQIISKNFDYTRKENCIKWYLELCQKTRQNKSKL